MATLSTLIKSFPVQTEGWVGTSKRMYASIAAPVANLGAGDIYEMFTLPNGARIVGVILKTTDLDINATETITLDVGDSGSINRLMAASIVAEDGGVDETLETTGMLHQYTADTQINVTLLGAAATAQAGTIELAVEYFMDR